MAIGVIPDPIRVVRIAKQLVVSEKESVGQLFVFLDLRIGLSYGATQRQREQQGQTCYQKPFHSIVPPLVVAFTSCRKA
jgi:hypothetical protein